jgi:hypothetical protein
MKQLTVLVILGHAGSGFCKSRRPVTEGAT